MRILLLVGLIALITACSHPLEIIGGGDIVSASGDRDCLLENELSGQASCAENLVAGAYQETYFAVPRPGWTFWHWRNYCTDSTDNQCEFSFDANQVTPFWGQTMPPLRAVFGPEGCTVGNNVEFVDEIDLVYTFPQVRYSLGFEIKAAEFTTPDSPDFGGQFTVASTTGNSGIGRRVWVSQCPGGPALDDARCDSTGTSVTAVRFYMQPHQLYCSLETNTAYYLNVQNLNCTSSSGCDVLRRVFTNGRL